MKVNNGTAPKYLIPRDDDHKFIKEHVKQWEGLNSSVQSEAPEFVFFWGGPYSQWAYSPFYYDAKWFPTAEHFMMWNKALCFEDFKRASMILDNDDPSSVKAIGREIENYEDEVWNAVRYEVVVLGNILKFSQNPNFYRTMVKDSNKIIVEASPYDKIWGIGRSESDPDLTNVDTWNGLNLLGYAIMDARAALCSNDLPKAYELSV